MNRWVKIVGWALILFLLSAQWTYAAGASSKTKVEVTFVRAELVDNDHVGNEWVVAGFVNGKSISEGERMTFTVKSTSSITLKAVAEEQDKIPDKGTKSKTIKVSSLSKKSTESELVVTVTENRGRYSGNTAEWKFIFAVKKV